MSLNHYCPSCNTGVARNDHLICPSCSAVRPPFSWPEDPMLGNLADNGRYRVERRLGAGGFGVVYEVTHTLVGQRRAMKVMDQQLVGQADVQRRFIDEWDILDKLDHPNIVRCYEIGVLPETKQPFMLLDLLQGHSLFEEIWPANAAHPRRMTPARAARLAWQVASALNSAHTKGLLHRDLKPDNILLVLDDKGREQAKVIDFGIAKILGTATIDRKTSRVVGTPEYMAPEQFNPGKELDGRLDLWQLGAVLCFAITGWPPYSVNEDDPLGIREMLQRKGLGPRPSAQVPAMAQHPGFDTLIASLLSTSPDDRPASADAVLRRLKELFETELDDPHNPTRASGALAAPEDPSRSTAGATVRTAGPSVNAPLVDDPQQPVSAKPAAKLQRGAAARRSGRQNAVEPDEPAATPGARRASTGQAAAVPQDRRPSSSRPEALATRRLEEQRSQRQQTQRRSRLLKWGLLAFVAVALAVVTALVVSWDELRQAPTAAQPKFVWVSSGEFDMGSPTSERGRFDNETLHKVTLTRPFFLQTTEVTQGQWAVVMGNSPSAFPECGPECPQENVSWWEALEYLNRRSVSEGFEKCYELTGCLGIPGSNFRCQSVAFKGLTCDGYRLPTEAEWEYAARASTDTMLPQGDLTQDQCSPKDPKLDPAGWYCGNAERKTHPIGQKTPNTWGLYDMAGNVTEWVWDWHFGDYGAAAATDPLGPDYGPGRAYRGCNWSSPPKDCRAANRGYSEPESRHSHLGFRAARTAY